MYNLLLVLEILVTKFFLSIATVQGFIYQNCEIGIEFNANKKKKI